MSAGSLWVWWNTRSRRVWRRHLLACLEKLSLAGKEQSAATAAVGESSAEAQRPLAFSNSPSRGLERSWHFCVYKHVFAEKCHYTCLVCCSLYIFITFSTHLNTRLPWTAEEIPHTKLKYMLSGNTFPVTFGWPFGNKQRLWWSARRWESSSAHPWAAWARGGFGWWDPSLGKFCCSIAGNFRLVAACQLLGYFELSTVEWKRRAKDREKAGEEGRERLKRAARTW